jgi:hypothetical protein
MSDRKERRGGGRERGDVDSEERCLIMMREGCQRRKVRRIQKWLTEKREI